FVVCRGISNIWDFVPGHFACSTSESYQSQVVDQWEVVTNTTILSSFVGDVVPISDSLRIQYSVGGTQDPNDLFFDPNLFSLVDIGVHEQFNVDVLTSGAGYITASGHNYTVPEPSTL